MGVLVGVAVGRGVEVGNGLGVLVALGRGVEVAPGGGVLVGLGVAVGGVVGSAQTQVLLPGQLGLRQSPPEQTSPALQP